MHVMLLTKYCISGIIRINIIEQKASKSQGENLHRFGGSSPSHGGGSNVTIAHRKIEIWKASQAPNKSPTGTGQHT